MNFRIIRRRVHRLEALSGWEVPTFPLDPCGAPPPQNPIQIILNIIRDDMNDLPHGPNVFSIDPGDLPVDLHVAEVDLNHFLDDQNINQDDLNHISVERNVISADRNVIQDDMNVIQDDPNQVSNRGCLVWLDPKRRYLAGYYDIIGWGGDLAICHFIWRGCPTSLR